MRKLLVYAAALPLLAMAACTVHQTDPGNLSGPSTLALELSVTATPDTLPQDGVSTSLIVVKAFNAGGQPYPNLAVRLDMQVNGTTQDLGTLATRTLLTATDGTASTTYTAPPGPSTGGTGSTVAVVATPISSDAASSGILNGVVGALFQAIVHLTPSGNVVGPKPETPTPVFTSTGVLTAGAVTLFNGTGSCPSTATSGVCDAAKSTLTNWDWDFGDGSTHGSGSIVTHAYANAQPYAVTLTVTNSQGGHASITSVITIALGTGPTALFTALPSPVSVNGTVTLNGAPSTGAPINFQWSITPPGGVATISGGANPQATFVANILGGWKITLTVTDAQGRSNTSAIQTVNAQ